MARKRNTDRVRLVPWRNPPSNELVIDVRRNAGYDFKAQTQYTLWQALAIALGLEYTEAFDSDDIIEVMVAAGYDSVLDESQQTRGPGGTLMNAPWRRQRTPSLIVRAGRRRFVMVGEGVDGE